MVLVNQLLSRRFNKNVLEEISQVNWDTFITANEGDMRYEYIKSAKVTIKNNILYVLSTELNSYVAAFIAEFFRY